MTTGERTWSSNGREVKKFENKPITPGEYDLKMGGDWVQKVAEGTGKLPYLNGSVEVLGTAATEGGKNRKVYHRLFLSLKPGGDGVVMPDRGNQLNGLAKGLGVDTPDDLDRARRMLARPDTKPNSKAPRKRR